MHQLAKGHGLPLAMICTTGQDGDSPNTHPIGGPAAGRASRADPRRW